MENIYKDFVAEVITKFDEYADEQSGQIDRLGVQLSIQALFQEEIKLDKKQNKRKKEKKRDLEDELEALVNDKMSGEEIGREECVTIAASASRYMEERGLKDAFITIATKNPANKNIPIEELHVDFPAIKALMRKLNDEDLPERDLDTMVREADTDNSGTIEIKEFVDYLLGPEEDFLRDVQKCYEKFTLEDTTLKA